MLAIYLEPVLHPWLSASLAQLVGRLPFRRIGHAPASAVSLQESKVLAGGAIKR
ncbi:hypothetical protein [uncultured Sphingomonas sp.]|uniref:hypothetical protein n=1 Tax=uncultured Sphingomonas sp. TaxID=158754 RepID=UPI0035C9DAF0